MERYYVGKENLPPGATMSPDGRWITLANGMVVPAVSPGPRESYALDPERGWITTSQTPAPTPTQDPWWYRNYGYNESNKPPPGGQQQWQWTNQYGWVPKNEPKPGDWTYGAGPPSAPPAPATAPAPGPTASGSVPRPPATTQPSFGGDIGRLGEGRGGGMTTLPQPPKTTMQAALPEQPLPVDPFGSRAWAPGAPGAATGGGGWGRAPGSTMMQQMLPKITSPMRLGAQTPQQTGAGARGRAGAGTTPTGGLDFDKLSRALAPLAGSTNAGPSFGYTQFGGTQPEYGRMRNNGGGQGMETTMQSALAGVVGQQPRTRRVEDELAAIGLVGRPF